MEQVGELFKNVPVVKKAVREVAFAESHRKLLDAATVIRLDPDAVERAYMARQLVQCTLPHSNPGNVPSWGRKSGGVHLTLQQGYDLDKPVGYPYGTIPRLLLFWITTEAVLTKNRRLELGHSLASFMREVGLDPSRGGSRSDAKRLRNQMERLFRCRISFDEQMTRADGTEGKRWLDMQVAQKGEYWWDPKRPEQGALWGSWLELGQTFFEMISAAPVPADMRALRALRRSPLALDLYVWSTYRAYSVSRKGAPQFVPWRSLMRQMGCDYGDVDNFKKNAIKALRKVRTVYPGLKLKTKPGGFDVLPCPPAVRPAIAARA